MLKTVSRLSKNVRIKILYIFKKYIIHLSSSFDLDYSLIPSKKKLLSRYNLYTDSLCLTNIKNDL